MQRSTPIDSSRFRLHKALLCTVIAAILSAPFAVASSDPAKSASAGEFSVENIVGKVKQTYSKRCCFRCSFDQLTVNVSMDLKDRFRGEMFVKKPSSIAMDVNYPEKQKIVIQGRSYIVYFPGEGTATRGEIPPELNVDQFLGFFADIGSIDRNFSAQLAPKSFEENEKLYLIELTNKGKPDSMYRILVGVDRTDFTIRRAIIYDALGNYNRFDLLEITFLPSIPESVFNVAPITDEDILPSPSTRKEHDRK
jgi:outer membrane lipoprotein-sorting protein